MTVEDREWLMLLSEGLLRARAEGEFCDIPQGARFIRLSETLRLQIAERLRQIAEQP